MKDTRITVISGIYRVDDYVSSKEMAEFLGRAFLGMKWNKKFRVASYKLIAKEKERV